MRFENVPPSSQELRGEVGEREGRVKELEVELLTASQKLAAGAGVHAHQLSEQAAQLDRCKVRMESQLRQLTFSRMHNFSRTELMKSNSQHFCFMLGFVLDFCLRGGGKHREAEL